MFFYFHLFFTFTPSLLFPLCLPFSVYFRFISFNLSSLFLYFHVNLSSISPLFFFINLYAFLFNFFLLYLTFSPFLSFSPFPPLKNFSDRLNSFPCFCDVGFSHQFLFSLTYLFNCLMFQKVEGTVDLGDGSKSNLQATQALVFMLTAGGVPSTQEERELQLRKLSK